MPERDHYINRAPAMKPGVISCKEKGTTSVPFPSKWVALRDSLGPFLPPVCVVMPDSNQGTDDKD